MASGATEADCVGGSRSRNLTQLPDTKDHESYG